MDLIWIVMSLFISVLLLLMFVSLLVANRRLSSIECSLRRLVLLELCDKGVFQKDYCEKYKKEVADVTVISLEGYRKNHGRDAIVGL